MVKRIKIGNFLSFASLDEKLGRRTVLIGPNMSGKTNFIECLRFLGTAVNPAAAAMPLAEPLGVGQPNPSPVTSMPSSLRRAFGYLGGFSEVIWKGSTDQTIEIGISVELRSSESEPAKTYEYEVAIEGNVQQDRISVVHERLTAQGRGQQLSVILERSGYEARYRRQPGEDVQTMRMPQADRLAIETISMPGSESDLFRNFVSSWRFYRLTPSQMKLANTSARQLFLMEFGANLSSWLFTLQGYPDQFQRITQVALDEFPSLTNILIQPAQSGMVYLSSTEKPPLKRPVPLARMSDGELTFLALLSLIFAPEELGAPLYCIEEPEAHLHPRLLETLVEMLNQRQQELGPRAAQIIVTTHSPLLVDKLDIRDLIVVEKTSGVTKFHRPSSNKHLCELVANKETGLGDLWYSGALGGN